MLFSTMLRIGAFTFGGGYAMLALLENEVVKKHGWLEREEFLDLTAIAESTPGPIAINAATYIGYRQMGFFGSLAATLGICLPSFVIVYLISLFFDAFLALRYVQYAFFGIRIGVIYLILSVGFRMLKKMKKDALCLIFFGVTLIGSLAMALLSVKLSTVVWILGSGSISLLLYFLRSMPRGKGGANDLS